jgi:sterol desaturase/sphingolipid hydroxylase (fatty acid hydroxylase superfamily)
VSDVLIAADRNAIWIAIGMAAMVLALEQRLPRPAGAKSPLRRWSVTALIAAFGVGLATLAQPLAMDVARAANALFGLPQLAQMSLPAWLLIVIALLLIDLVAYATHLAFHQVPYLWRLHKLHHADQEIDATTGFFHHPLESVATLLLQLTVLAVLGVPLLVIIAYNLMMHIWNPITHTALPFPAPLERTLGVLLVTPRMHRLHHSVRMDESNSNFGMLFSLWDRLFGTYRAPTEEPIRFGLAEDRIGPPQVWRALAAPFIRPRPPGPPADA